jgi:hypothetical protein
MLQGVSRRGHPEFGGLVFQQKFPVLAGIGMILFGGVALLVGIACFGMMSARRPKLFIAGIGGVVAGVFFAGAGLFHILFKGGKAYRFYERGFVFSLRTGRVELPYPAIKSFMPSTSKTSSSDEEPTTHYTLRFILPDGHEIKVEFEVGDNDFQKKKQVEEAIRTIRSGMVKRGGGQMIDSAAPAQKTPGSGAIPLDDGPIPLDDSPKPAPPRPVPPARPASSPPPARPAGNRPPPPPPPPPPRRS